MISTIVMITNNLLILDLSCQPFGSHFFDFAGATSHHFYLVGVQGVDRALSYIASEHQFYTYIRENCGDIRFATAASW